MDSRRLGWGVDVSSLGGNGSPNNKIKIKNSDGTGACFHVWEWLRREKQVASVMREQNKTASEHKKMP